jgi:spore germination cell wall hydrolase CwlJ-like protein
MRVVADEAWAVLTIWQEARSEPQDGRVAVAEVIRNRLAKKYNCSGKSVADCVLAPLQFSGWNSHDPNRIFAATIDDDDPIVAQCYDAWNAAQSGTTVAHGALLYLNPAIAVSPPPWVAACVEVARIGRHVFYVPK